MSIATRYVDIHSKPVPVVRTRSVTEPVDGGTRPVTREEYEALLARVVALEAVTRNVTRDADRNATAAGGVTAVTHNADDTVTRNASNAERQRRYRERHRLRRQDCSA